MKRHLTYAMNDNLPPLPLNYDVQPNFNLVNTDLTTFLL